MLTQGAGVNFGFPDVCLTPIPPVPIPIPYPNISVTATTAPSAYNVMVDCMPTVNLLSKGLVSFGDEGGVAGGGVLTHMIDGQAEYILGCFTIFMGGAPAQRLTSMTGQNSLGMMPNAPGVTLVPSQVTVLTLG